MDATKYGRHKRTATFQIAEMLFPLPSPVILSPSSFPPPPLKGRPGSDMNPSVRIWGEAPAAKRFPGHIRAHVSAGGSIF